MPILYPNQAPACAVFTGACTPEEADGLLDWLRATPAPRADLSGCMTLHTALLQLLLAGGVAIAAPPADPLLMQCLAQSLPAVAAEPAPQPARKRRARAAAQT